MNNNFIEFEKELLEIIDYMKSKEINEIEDELISFTDRGVIEDTINGKRQLFTVERKIK